MSSASARSPTRRWTYARKSRWLATSVLMTSSFSSRVTSFVVVASIVFTLLLVRAAATPAFARAGLLARAGLATFTGVTRTGTGAGTVGFSHDWLLSTATT